MGGSDYTTSSSRGGKDGAVSITWLDTCGQPIPDYNKADQLIMATILTSTVHTPPAQSFKLQWSNNTDNPSVFFDLTTSGELRRGISAGCISNTDPVGDPSGCAGGTVDASEEVENENPLQTASLSCAKNNFIETHWCIDFSNALDGKTYIFQMYDATEGVACGGSVTVMVTTETLPTLPQTDSRIASNSASWQGACDVDITGWTKSSDFILSTYATGGDGVKVFKLQWKEAGGSFADVGAATEINYNANTVLVDLNPVATPAGCLSSTVSQENEGDNTVSAITMGASEVVEIQWGLDCSGAQDDTIYEFQLVCTTDATQEVCSCSLRTAPAGCQPQTDSRIANASASWQGACDIDISSWVKTNEFILATWATGGDGGNKNFKLQWKESGGSFADVGADTEIKYGTGTVLVDGNNVATTSACLSSTKSEENEGDNSATLDTMGASDVGEVQWALGFGSGAQDGVTYEFQLVNTSDTQQEICSCSITTFIAGGYAEGIERGILRGIESGVI